MEVPATRTPATETEMRAALRAGGATSAELPALLAHTAIETARWRSLIQHNVGNLTANDEGAAPFWRPQWFEPPGPDSSERIKRLHEGMLEGTQPNAFRAYPSLAAGVEDYLELLRKPRFRPMMRAVRSPERFVKAWRSTGYTPDLDVEATLRNFERLWREFGGHPRTPPVLLLGAAALGFWWYKRQKRNGS